MIQRILTRPASMREQRITEPLLNPQMGGNDKPTPPPGGAHRVCCLGDDAIYGKAQGLRGFQLSGSSLRQSSG
ncbi:MAG: hypothetical protein M2R45_05480 [Verrucomicrobia subdivision 3 bacterium]|nr:hypothetical protein [Limisphaerales bacterium]MCS1412275.1 hypothetical protein [Limisphaerales bacterium]